MKISDIKYANLIFAEHSKLLKENTLIYKQLENYQNSNQILLRIDSIRKIQVKELQKSNLEYSEKVTNLDNLIVRKDKLIKYWKIGGITVSVGLLIFLLVK